MTPKPDLVVSGINRGYNLATRCICRGRLARHARVRCIGVPAIAASLAEAGAPRDFVSAAEEVLGVARRVKQYGLPPSTFLNVNIPGVPPDGYKGYMITTQASQQERQGEPSPRRSIRQDARSTGTCSRKAAPVAQGTDSWAVANGYVSVTPMSLGEDDPSQMDAWRAIFK